MSSASQGARAVCARLQLKVVPKAAKNEIVGWLGSALKVRVTAVPARGAANAAVLDMIATALRLPRQSVRLVAGQTTARKIIEVMGLSESELRLRFADRGKP